MKNLYLKIVSLIVFIFIQTSVFGQLNDDIKADPNYYTKFLLTSMVTQIEATEAVNDLYNFKFAKAEQQFRWIKQKYPNHPMPYFLLGFSEWWKIVPSDDGYGQETPYDKKFVKYMDSAIYFAEMMYDEDEENIDAIFFLSAAYGFLGRIYSDRKMYAKATIAGRKALNYLKEGKKYIDISPEMLFGEGLFNYYAEWIRENYLMLRPVLMFFPDGDKKLGLKQLEEVSINAFYTRVESQYFRMRILSYEENKKEDAYIISKYLVETFPDNAYFQRFHAQTTFGLGKILEAELISLDIISKIDSGYVGYEAISGRYASYFLGWINQNIRRDYEKAKNYYLRCIEFSEQKKSDESVYYHQSILNAARLFDKSNDIENAKKYYKKYTKFGEKGSKEYKEAKRYKKK